MKDKTLAVTLMLMAVTGTLQAANAPLLLQIEKIAASPVLHGSDALCKLLRYLAHEAIENPGIPIKEYRIATEVFGRPREFDPKLDSTVRVQTGRLRSKLGEYFSTLGTGDDFLVEIPKGAYLLTFHPREIPAIATPAGSAAPTLSVDLRSNIWTKNWKWLIALLFGIPLLALGSFVTLRYQRVADSRAALLRAEGFREGDLSTLRRFWAQFIQEREAPIVVYSNAEFVGRPETGMRYLQPTDSKEAILDHYTGVGEVMAVHELDRVFSVLHEPLRIKRGRLLTFDDAQSNNLIFVGSPSENLSLRDLPITQEFVFHRTNQVDRKGDLSIANVHPRPGEQTEFFATKGVPVSEDYAVMGLVRNDRRQVLILAGTTTFGTQAAVEFVCNPDRVRELLQRVAGDTADIRPFESVLRVRVSKGVPVLSRIAALHVPKN